MKLSRTLTCLFCLAMGLVFTNPLTGQTLTADNLRTISVDKLSDQEILNYYQQAKASGLSDDQLLKMAIDRGLPSDEAIKLRARLTTMTGGVSRPQKIAASTDQTREVILPPTDSVLLKVKRDTTIFGSELFTTASSVFEPNIKIATPGSYVLGTDDELIVSVYGYSEQTYNLRVNNEGFVYIANVGPLLVSGLTIEEATLRIRNKLAATIYKAINTGQTKVSVTLGKIRSISVMVMGQAIRPGSYTVTSLTTLFNLFYISGGPSDKGSFRRIEVIRGDKVYKVVDLYSFLLRGDRKDNILLKDQDVIRIPYYDTRIVIGGEVKRPGKFELRGGENLDQVLTYCGGFTDSAYRGQIKVTRINDLGRELTDVKAEEFSSFLPKTGDIYAVSKALSRYLNRVTIAGAVMRPGDFELKPGMNLKELIESAGGLRADAYKDHGFIARLKDDLTASSVPFSVNDVVKGVVEVILKREDFVSITSIFDLKDALTIDIQGEVRKPGHVLFRENLTLNDLLLLAEGFTERANPKVIEISRRIRNPEVLSTDYRQVEVIKADLSGGAGSEAGKIKLQPFDLVVVRPSGSYETQRSVFVQGEVLSPGRFVLENSRENISSILRRTGGFKGGADSGSLTIKRVSRTGVSEEERQKIVQRLLNINRDSLINNPQLRETYLSNIDLLSVNIGNIKDNPGGPEDLTLEDGDLIEVSRASSLVRVSGEVFHPTLLPHEKNSNAHDFIKRSGNFTSNARRSRTFVIYPDGRATSVKKFLFFKSYPDVTPRSEIFVPAKDKEGKKNLSSGEWIALSSIIATLATMAITIVNSLN